MKKLLILPFFAGLFLNASAQIYMAKTCTISFFSEAPIENIEAVNKSAQPVLNTSTGDIQVRVPIKGFKFEKPLMEEHFNENYMETEKFPTATFKGKINEKVDFTKDGETNVTVTGMMNIHGVEKEKTITGTLTVKGNQIILNTKFNIVVAEYGIKIPNMYVKNIGETVETKLSAVLEPYKKQ
jgi:hypothetical protein